MATTVAPAIAGATVGAAGIMAADLIAGAIAARLLRAARQQWPGVLG